MPFSSNDSDIEHLAKMWREFLWKHNWVHPLLIETHTHTSTDT